MILDREQVAHYERYGWVSVPGFFDFGDAGRLQDWADELAAMPQISGAQMVYYGQDMIYSKNRILQRVDYFRKAHAGFDGLFNDGRLPAAIAQLLSEPTCLFKGKINFKYPGGGGFQADQEQQAGWSLYALVFLVMAGFGMHALLRAAVRGSCIVAFVVPVTLSARFDTITQHLRDQGIAIYPGKLTVAETSRIGCMGVFDDAAWPCFFDCFGAGLSLAGWEPQAMERAHSRMYRRDRSRSTL